MFGRAFKFPIPKSLPSTCDNCGAKLHWQPVVYRDPVIGVDKVDHYKADCSCGEVHYRDGRGQVVEPAIENLAPDRSDVAHSPQGEVPYSGYMEFVKQEREKAEALKKTQAAKAAAAAAGADKPASVAAGGERPAAAGAPAGNAPTPPANSEEPAAE
ncbi:MAG TPA: hypothetical protein VG329_08630 [Candidatus Dormibacteraeota bacterium]|jgi:hypothetical protein|nr:hypothetical protein [Candidatus Dormibacteraeota bacterium]